MVLRLRWDSLGYFLRSGFLLLWSLALLSVRRRRKAGILPSLEDLLFYTIAEGQERIPAHKFTTVRFLQGQGQG